LASELPSALHTQSRLICRISGEVLNNEKKKIEKNKRKIFNKHQKKIELNFPNKPKFSIPIKQSIKQIYLFIYLFLKLDY